MTLRMSVVLVPPHSSLQAAKAEAQAQAKRLYFPGSDLVVKGRQVKYKILKKCIIFSCSLVI